MRTCLMKRRRKWKSYLQMHCPGGWCNMHVTACVVCNLFLHFFLVFLLSFPSLTSSFSSSLPGFISFFTLFSVLSLLSIFPLPLPFLHPLPSVAPPSLLSISSFPFSTLPSLLFLSSPFPPPLSLSLSLSLHFPFSYPLFQSNGGN